jgi:hypothetical protein
MFQVLYRENGVLYAEEHTTEQAAERRAMHLRRTCGLLAWVETNWGEYRWVR